jgi:saccharopine dehydrogenase (NAD+, L-lysine-forming)
MKAVVLGGAGVIGSYAVKCLTESSTFSEVLIADASESRGKSFADKYEKVSFVKIDATNEENLNQMIKDADVAVNCVGPFYKFAPKILNSAISQGVDYVDVCDDYDTTQDLLDEYHKKAQDAGVTCIVGLGASPGLTNVVAAYASSKLTKVDDITVCVTRGIDEEAGGAIPYHMLHCWLGEIPVFKNGSFTKGRGLVDGKEMVTFPKPFGQTNVYYFGHPETVTLPRYIKGVQNVSCKGTFFPQIFRKTLLQLDDLGLISDEKIDMNGIEFSPIDFLASAIPLMIMKLSTQIEDIPIGGSVLVKVVGEKDGIPKSYTYGGIARMREGTATPAAVGAEMIIKGEIKSPGVHAPEGCVPPAKFLNNLIDREGFGDTFITVQDKITGPIE